MGDKGGKKNKEKSQKQSGDKQKQKEQHKVDKQPKTKAVGVIKAAAAGSHLLVPDPAASDRGGLVRITIHPGQVEGAQLLTLPDSWRMGEQCAHFLRAPQ